MSTILMCVVCLFHKVFKKQIMDKKNIFHKMLREKRKIFHVSVRSVKTHRLGEDIVCVQVTEVKRHESYVEVLKKENEKRKQQPSKL